jgi:tRNA-dihydrouridine synthase B
VIGNGDVTEPEHVPELMRRSGCHGVMVGRGSLRTPWIFRRALGLLRTGTLPPEPTFAEKLACIARHLELLCLHHDEAHVLHCMRSRISWYGKTMGHVKGLKEAFRTAPDTDRMRAALDEWLLVATSGYPVPGNNRVDSEAPRPDDG